MVTVPLEKDGAATEAASDEVVASDEDGVDLGKEAVASDAGMVETDVSVDGAMVAEVARGVRRFNVITVMNGVISLGIAPTHQNATIADRPTTQ